MRQKGLQELCLRLLAVNIDQCPPLEYIPSELCDRLFELVLELHPLNPQTLRLLGTVCAPSLATLDLSTKKAVVNERILLGLLGSLTSLTTLALRDEPRGVITAKVLQRIASLSELRSLSLSKCVGIKDVSMRFLQHLRKLETLKLDGFKGITASGLMPLKDLSNLKELSIIRCQAVAVFDFFSRRVMAQLEVLDIGFTGLRGDHLRALLACLAKAGRLRKLSVRGLSVSPRLLADEIVSLGSVRAHHYLTALSLGSNVRLGQEADLLKVANFSCLAALDLERTMVNSAGVVSLGSTGLAFTLQVLGLAGTQVKEDVMGALAAFRKLQLVDLSFVSFKATSLADFLGGPALCLASPVLVDLRFCEWRDDPDLGEIWPSLSLPRPNTLLLEEEQQALAQTREGIWQRHFA